jgi:Transposase
MDDNVLYIWVNLLQPQVARVLVCDPRRNAFLKEGNKSDKVDARKLADLLRTGMLRPVYHGEHGLRTLRELGRSYQTLSQDLNRVMKRIKVYAPRYREEWLQKIEHAGMRRRAELLYQRLDGLQGLRRTLRPELLAESRKQQSCETTTSDSLHRSDPSRPLDRVDADAAPVPEQTATLDL